MRDEVECGPPPSPEPGPPSASDPVRDARLALALLALDPAGLGGVYLRTRIGAAHDAVMKDARRLPQPHRRIAPSITDDQLFGGFDLETALSTGRILRRKGVLDTAGAMILPMAERIEPELAARLGMALDAGDAPPMVVIDEGADEEEVAPTILTERLALHVDLSLARSDDAGSFCEDALMPAITANLPEVTAEQIEALTRVAVAFGVLSMRAPIFAARAAAASARFHGRPFVEKEDMEIAVRLVIAPRATRAPVMEEPEEDAPPPPEDQPERSDADQGDGDNNDRTDADMLTDAEAALLPDDILRFMAGAASRAKAGQGAGQKTSSFKRGRPLPSRAGLPDGRKRLDLLATLRAAAPMQKIRTAGRDRVKFRRGDLHLKRFKQRRERLIIFAVDLSGSAARARLGEAKGAVELMLSRAYSERDHVALVGFRGTEAEVMLPPTRSLVLTKRRLSDAPGGGGTPLASGLFAAMQLAERARRAGMTPYIVTLTDGRANIALDGTASRERAAEDALTQARAIGAMGFGGAVIDTGRRPEPALAKLAQAMEARYSPLPLASPAKLSETVASALGG
ncbi:MAG: magnesium chelatase subunit D [Pseudomonadota bacterium]